MIPYLYEPGIGISKDDMAWGGHSTDESVVTSFGKHVVTSRHDLARAWDDKFRMRSYAPWVNPPCCRPGEHGVAAHKPVAGNSSQIVPARPKTTWCSPKLVMTHQLSVECTTSQTSSCPESLISDSAAGHESVMNTQSAFSVCQRCWDVS